MAGDKPAAPVSGVSSDSKLFGALAYVFSFITGIIVFLMKKDDPYAKFHAMQSIIVGVCVFVLYIVLGILMVILGFIPIINILAAIIGIVVFPLLGLCFFILWLLLIWKAYSGEKFKLPIVGAQAEKMAMSM